MGEAISVRPFGPGDVAWAESLIGADLGGRLQARLGELVDALSHPGFVAVIDHKAAGIVTVDVGDTEVEIVYIEAAVQHRGVGTALLEAVLERRSGRRLWLVTTNDNLDALRFYQRRGFVIGTVRPGAVGEARRTLKPSIPRTGRYDIPIRDELVMEYVPASSDLI